MYKAWEVHAVKFSVMREVFCQEFSWYPSHQMIERLDMFSPHILNPAATPWCRGLRKTSVKSVSTSLLQVLKSITSNFSGLLNYIS